jgi:hypothetical protein
MRIPRRYLAFFPACFLWVGCQSPYRANIVVDPGHEVRLSSSSFYVDIPVLPIVFQTKESNISGATRGGLLWELVDMGVNASRQMDAQNAGAPIYQALSAISLPAELKKRFETKLGEFSWLGAKTVEIRSPEEIEEIKKEGKTAFTRVAVNPEMDPTFSVLTFRLLVELFDQDKRSEGAKREPLYRLTWDDKVDVIEGGTDAKANAAVWMASEGKRIKDAYNKGIDQTSEKVLKALSDLTLIPS